MSRAFHSPNFHSCSASFIPPFSCPSLSSITLFTSNKWGLKYLSSCNRIRCNVVWIHPFCSVVRITSLFKANIAHGLCHIWVSWSSRLLPPFSYSDSIAMCTHIDLFEPLLLILGVYIQKWNFARIAIFWSIDSLVNLCSHLMLNVTRIKLIKKLIAVPYIS